MIHTTKLHCKSQAELWSVTNSTYLLSPTNIITSVSFCCISGSKILTWITTTQDMRSVSLNLKSQFTEVLSLFILRVYLQYSPCGVISTPAGEAGVVLLWSTAAPRSGYGADRPEPVPHSELHQKEWFTGGAPAAHQDQQEENVSLIFIISKVHLRTYSIRGYSINTKTTL